MKRRDVLDLLMLAAAWGAAFLFMRVCAPEFGPLALIELRVAIAALLLVPLLLARGGWHHLRGNWAALWVLGTTNSALPFTLLAFSTLTLPGGFTSVLNATAPMWGALIAWGWLGERLSRGRVAGLCLGVIGIVILAWDKLVAPLASGAGSGAGDIALALGAGMLATLFYGFSANFVRRRLSRVEPLAVAAGSQITAAAVLAPAAWWTWPHHDIAPAIWLNVLVLGVWCTGIAFILYFRLIANVGPARAISVTFLVPVFGVLWGALLLHEPVGPRMVAGGLVILLGTGLATGLLSLRKSALQPAADRAASAANR